MKSKIWQLSAWRKRRKEFITDKSCSMCGSKENLAIHHPQKKNSLTDLEYESFEGAIILCKRCHGAYHKGWVLCPICKKNYAKFFFKQCSECHKKEKKEQEKFDEKMDREEDELLVLTEDYDMRLEYCGNCEHHIEVKQELFCGLSPKILCNVSEVTSGVRRFKE